MTIRTETNAPGLGARSDGVLLDHVQKLIHPILHDFSLDDDANRHGAKRCAYGRPSEVSRAGGVDADGFLLGKSCGGLLRFCDGMLVRKKKYGLNGQGNLGRPAADIRQSRRRRFVLIVAKLPMRIDDLQRRRLPEEGRQISCSPDKSCFPNFAKTHVSIVTTISDLES